MQMETIGVTIDLHHTQIFKFADDLNIQGSIIEDTERVTQVFEQAASKIGLKFITEKTKIIELSDKGDNT